MINKKTVSAYYLYDEGGKLHKYEFSGRGISGEIYLRKGDEIPKEVTIKLKVKDAKT